MPPWLATTIELAIHWWPLLVALSLPFVLSTVATSAFFLAARVRERRRPDTLPLSTGEWVAEQIEALGLTGEVEVGLSPTGGNVDAYWPESRYLGLNRKTFNRRDPAFWAIGAHELGHALTLRRHAALQHGLPAARAVVIVFERLAIAILLVNIALGWTPGLWLAAAAIGISLVANVVVVADEGFASLQAWRILRSDARLDAGDHRVVASSLVAAFVSYLGAVVGRIVLLGAFPWLVGLYATVDGPPPPDAPTWWLVGMVFALTALLGKRAVQLILRAVKPKQVHVQTQLAKEQWRQTVGDLAGALGAAALVGLTWRTPMGPIGALCLALAIVPVLGPILGMLRSGVFVALGLVLREVDRANARLALYEGHVQVEIPTTDTPSPPPRAALDPAQPPTPGAAHPPGAPTRLRAPPDRLVGRLHHRAHLTGLPISIRRANLGGGRQGAQSLRDPRDRRRGHVRHGLQGP